LCAGPVLIDQIDSLRAASASIRIEAAEINAATGLPFGLQLDPRHSGGRAATGGTGLVTEALQGGETGDRKSCRLLETKRGPF
jgi:hypothetical protein